MNSLLWLLTVVFVQAEDCIRDYKVTGVQTCALPIFTEDDRHADYILMVDRLCTYQGSRLASKRNEVRKFLRLCPRTRFDILDLNRASTIEQCQRSEERV